MRHRFIKPYFETKALVFRKLSPIAIQKLHHIKDTLTMKANKPVSNAYNNLPILLWIAKDACWMLGLQSAALFLAVPAVITAIHIAWLNRTNTALSFRHVAISYWVGANVLWMYGQFYNTTAVNPYAMVLFTAGAVVAVSYYAFIWPAENAKAKNENMQFTTSVEALRKAA